MHTATYLWLLAALIAGLFVYLSEGTAAAATTTTTTLYAFEYSYAVAISAEVDCFLEKAWTPLASVASAFESDFPTAQRADSGWQIDDNVTMMLEYFIFRSTASGFTAMFCGFENGKFIMYGRLGTNPKPFKPSLVYTKDENATCDYKPYNISRSCRFSYLNATNPTTGAIAGKPSSARSYDPRVRSWYVGAKADTVNGGTFWSSVYGFASGGVGITAAQQLLSSSGSFLGVVGIDIKLGELASILSGEFESTDDDSAYDDGDVNEDVFTAFIVDASENLVAASEPGYAYRNGSQVPAVNCSYKTIAVTARFFGSRNKGYSDSAIQMFTDVKGRLHWARSEKYEDNHGLGWYIVVVQRVDCPSGYSADNHSASCIQCPSPFTSKGGHFSTSCYEMCVEGYYLNENGDCSECKYAFR
jgi:hypothetical protein